MTRLLDDQPGLEVALLDPRSILRGTTDGGSRWSEGREALPIRPPSHPAAADGSEIMLTAIAAIHCATTSIGDID